MSKDISKILEGWDFHSNEIIVRKIKGLDGKDKIQMRLDLGLLQFEVDGRPDGKMPFGYESLLDYFESEVMEHIDKDENFKLSAEDCIKLQYEGVQYYHRYICFFQLEDYHLAERDTERNLRLFDFVNNYASDESDKIYFEQYRPYVLMMNTRARSSIALKKGSFEEAYKLIKEGIEKIKHAYHNSNQDQLITESREIAFLTQWKDSIEENRPVSKLENLERQLKLAVNIQEYERAAELRDKIRRLKNQS